MTAARNLFAWLMVLLVVGASAGASTAVALAIELPDEDDFNVVEWELRNIPGKWLYLVDRFFTGGLSTEEENERLQRFLDLSAEIRSLEAVFDGGPDEAVELRILIDQRDAVENAAEAVIEGRLTEVLKDAGLESSWPLFPDARWVWPPVDVEFDEPPRSLSISPRVRIELIERRALRPGLSLEEAIAREAEVESAGDVAALAGTLAGVGTYPSLVAPHGRYEQLVSTVAHEWVHNYLFFKPLGERYYDSIELRTLNETVADLAGDAIAALVVERYPLPDASGQPAPVPQNDLDVDAFLRQLRSDVELLLTAGQIEAAEAYMERQRLELAEQGVFYRRINQAFFAARGIYATSPGAVDPTGPKLRTLLQRSDDVGVFLRVAATFTSVVDLDAVLAEAESGLE